MLTPAMHALLACLCALQSLMNRQFDCVNCQSLWFCNEQRWHDTLVISPPLLFRHTDAIRDPNCGLQHVITRNSTSKQHKAGRACWLPDLWLLIAKSKKNINSKNTMRRIRPNYPCCSCKHGATRVASNGPRLQIASHQLHCIRNRMENGGKIAIINGLG